MRALLLALPLAFAVGHASAQAPAPAAKPAHPSRAAGREALAAEVAAANAKWSAAYSAGDAAAIAALYTDNATVLPAGAPMVSGRAAIQTFWQGVIQSGLKNFALTTVSVDNYGRAAREIGTFTVDAPGASGAVNHLTGKYVVVWKRDRGGVQLDSDIWNMDK